MMFINGTITWRGKFSCALPLHVFPVLVSTQFWASKCFCNCLGIAIGPYSKYHHLGVLGVRAGVGDLLPALLGPQTIASGPEEDTTVDSRIRNFPVKMWSNIWLTKLDVPTNAEMGAHPADGLSAESIQNL